MLNYWGILLLGSLATLWILGSLGEVKVVQEFAAVAILEAIAWTLLGTRVVRALAFPLLFLFFAVPFGVSLIPPLRDFTAWFVVHALTLSNVPVVLENHKLSLPSGEWTVAETCSGIRYLFSSLVVGAIFSYVMYRSRKRRMLFLAASIMVPIVANGVRAYGIVLLAYLTDNRLALGIDHLIYGGVFFVAVQVALISVGFRWSEASDAAEAVTPEVPATQAPGRFAVLVVSVFCVVLIGSASAIAGHLWKRASAPMARPDPPVHVNPPWRSVPGNDLSLAPKLRTADQQFSESFTNGLNRVDLYWMLYSGRDTTDLVASYNIADPKRWQLATERMGSTVIDGHRNNVRQNLIESANSSRSVWTWYWVGGEYTPRPERVRFLQAKARLFGGSAAVAIISVGADNQGDIRATELILQDFLLHATFPRTSGS